MRGPLNAGSSAPGLIVGVDLQLVLPRRRVRHDFDDVAERRDRAHAVHGRVEIEPARQPRATLVAVGARHADDLEQPLIHAGAEAGRPRHAVAVVQQVAVGRRDHAELAGIGEGRVQDVDLLLPQTIDPQRLFVGAVGQPVVEDAGAAAQRRLAALERRPRDPEARPEILRIADVGLGLVADAGAQREVLPRADVVLHVERRLEHAIRQVRIADALGVVARPARVERLQIVEGVGPEVIRPRHPSESTPRRAAVRCGSSGARARSPGRIQDSGVAHDRRRSAARLPP